MKLADAVAVYEGRRPAVSNQSIDQWITAKWAELLLASPAPTDDVYSHQRELGDKLEEALAAEMGLNDRIRKFAGPKRPRSLSWRTSINGDGPYDISVIGVPYRGQYTKQALMLRRYGSPRFTPEHHAIAQADGLGELDMYVLLSCWELSRPRRRRWRPVAADEPLRVAERYVELATTLMNTAWA